jgi:type II secretory pathway component PulJ
MSALHFKLQNSLLSFTSNEAIKRAEVEHQLARREVEILQSSEYRNRHGPPEVKPLQPISNVELEAALKRNQELERVNATLDRRLRRAKKLIEQEKQKSELLMEENGRLKNRIRENREHFSWMIERGSLSPSPRTQSRTPQRKPVPHFHDSTSPNMSRGESHPFAALLAADRVLNRESSDFQSSPQRMRPRQHSNGHVRGTHSLSSLPMTPSQSRTTREHLFFTPTRNTQEEQRDRDSTISASDIEEADTEEDIPASQADSPATSMLRPDPGVSQQETRAAAIAPKTSTLLQTKLFGQVRKAGVDRPPNGLKRKASIDDGAALKKSKAAEGVGLGIEA